MERMTDRAANYGSLSRRRHRDTEPVGLPPDLIEQLIELLERERQMARTLQRHDREALDQLIAASYAAGWTYADIARGTGMPLSTVARRGKHGAAHLSSTTVVPAAVANDWLPLRLAWRYAEVTPSTIRLWQRTGWLPQTRPDEHGRWLYATADLSVVAQARRRLGRLPNGSVSSETAHRCESSSNQTGV